MRKPLQRPGMFATLLVAFCIAAWLPPVVSADNAFSIAVIPDTQNYVDELKAQPESFNDFLAETRHLANNKATLDLAFVTHVGDVVQHGDRYASEWTRAYQAMEVLSKADVPFGMTPGNHDYDNMAHSTNNRPLRGGVMWNRYFGATSAFFAGKPWYGGADVRLLDSAGAPSANAGMSSCQTFSAGGKKFLNISLQMEAGDNALAWAQSMIDGHPGYDVIITTHSYLSPPAPHDNSEPLAIPATRNQPGYLVNSPDGWNGARQMWDKLISKNDRVFMVLCGHMWNPPVDGVSQGENIRVDANSFGHPVYQLLTDFQGNTVGIDGIPGHEPGGAGWLRFMTFDMVAKTIHFRTYSPVLNKFAGANGENTFGQPAAFSDFTLPMPR